MSSTLQTMQNHFQNYLLEDDESIHPEIIHKGKISVASRLDIYRNAYYLRLIDILGMDYPVIKTILGKENFAKMMAEYIQAYPSTHYSVRVYGRNLAKFLVSFPEAEPYLAEMATFEWKLTEILEAKDAPVLTIEEISQIPPQDWAMLRFSIHPAVQFLPFHTNVPELWRMVQENEIEIAEISKKVIRSDEQPQYWMIWRFNLEAYFNSLNSEQLYMLQAIQAGKTFGEICEELCQWLEEDQVIQFAAGNLRSWVGDGIFTSFSICDH